MKNKNILGYYQDVYALLRIAKNMSEKRRIAQRMRHYKKYTA